MLQTRHILNEISFPQGTKIYLILLCVLNCDMMQLDSNQLVYSFTDCYDIKNTRADTCIFHFTICSFRNMLKTVIYPFRILTACLVASSRGPARTFTSGTTGAVLSAAGSWDNFNSYLTICSVCKQVNEDVSGIIVLANRYESPAAYSLQVTWG